MGLGRFSLYIYYLLCILEKVRAMENQIDKEAKIAEKLKSAQINNALGIFTLFFGIIIIVATLFTETFVGLITNLVAGFIISSIGGGMILFSRKTRKSLK